jgi:hypothetical protein
MIKVTDLRGTLPINPDPKRVYHHRNINRIKNLVLHCDDIVDSANPTIQSIANYDIGPNHISPRGCPGFTYHFFITADGQINYTQDAKVVTWHVGNWNTSSLGVCIRYRATHNPDAPNQAMLASSIRLFTLLCLDLGLSPNAVVGHRELFKTGWIYDEEGNKDLLKTCPGLLVNLNVVRQAVAHNLQSLLKKGKWYTGEIDSIWGPKSKAAMVAYKKVHNAKLILK